MSNITIGNITGTGTIIGDNNSLTIYSQARLEDIALLNRIRESMSLCQLKLPCSFESLRRSLDLGDLNTFFQSLQAIFATLPYDAKVTEGYFHSHIHVLLKALGFDIRSEVETNLGRIDSVVETLTTIYIFEFKKDDSEIAIKQTLERKYYQPYQAKKKPVVLVGVGLNFTEKNISDWQRVDL